MIPAPVDVQALMPDPSIPLCDACVTAYRNGITPGETACEEVRPMAHALTFKRTVTYEIEAPDPATAERVWEDNGPECAEGVQVVETTDIEPVTGEPTEHPPLRRVRVRVSASADLVERWLADVPANTPEVAVGDAAFDEVTKGVATFEGQEVSNERDRELVDWEEV